MQPGHARIDASPAHVRWRLGGLLALLALAVRCAAAPDTIGLAEKQYLDLRARSQAIRGKALIELRRDAPKLHGRIVELQGQISGVASSPAPGAGGDQRLITFLLQTSDDSVFMEAIENEPEVRVGNRVSVLALMPGKEGSLHKLEMVAIAQTDRLPDEGASAEASLPRSQRRDQPGALPPELAHGRAAPLPAEPAPKQRPAEQERIETWKAFVAKYNRRLSDAERDLIVRCVLAYSAMYNIDHRLTFAMIQAESNFNPRCRSHKGAMGLTQLMPPRCEEYGIADPYDIQQNIWGGCRELGGYLRRYEGRPNYEHFSLSMACYNAGSGAVRKYGGVPPYRETVNYIKKVGKLFVKLVRESYP